MEGIKTYSELSKIPELEYEGYVWMSDKPGPCNAKEFDFKNIEPNPFIQEALLYSKEENISVMIRHTGDYQISEFRLNELPKDAVLENKKYFSHRLKEICADKKVCIQQLWIPEGDENCEKMEVLTLKAHIFTGFSN